MWPAAEHYPSVCLTADNLDQTQARESEQEKNDAEQNICLAGSTWTLPMKQKITLHIKHLLWLIPRRN